MPLSHKEISDLVAGAATEAAALMELRHATRATVVRLSDDMAAAVGAVNGYRRLTPFLGTVVATIASKLEIDDAALRASKVKDTKQLAQWLGDNQWSVIERTLYETAARDGSAYVMVRWENGPRYTVRELFDGVTGAKAIKRNGETAFVINGWKAGDTFYLDVYYPASIEKYQRKAEGQWEPRSDAPDESWPIAWTNAAGEPLGIPLIELSIGKSDIDDAVQLGRDMNEALLDLIATSRLQGWPQRYLKGQKDPNVLLNEAGQPLVSPITGKPFPRTMQLLPGSVMLIGKDAELGQLEGAATNTGALDKLLELLSLVTTVPTHYFNGQWPSGVALIQAESRLNHKVEGHQGRLTPAIVAMLRLSMRLSNEFAGTAFFVDQELTVPWLAPQIETEDLRIEREKATTDRVIALHGAGLMSRFLALRTLYPAWSDAEITEELARLETRSDVGPATTMDPTSDVGPDTE